MTMKILFSVFYMKLVDMYGVFVNICELNIIRLHETGELNVLAVAEEFREGNLEHHFCPFQLINSRHRPVQIQPGGLTPRTCFNTSTALTALHRTKQD